MGALSRALFAASLAGFGAAGCTVLFEPGSRPGDAGAEESPDAAGGAGVSCEDSRCVARSMIGALDRDFSTIGAWESAREGDLINRALIEVGERQGTFQADELVEGDVSGCSGDYIPANEAGDNAPVLTLDSFGGSCQPGEALIGTESEASAVHERLLGIGVVEEGVLYADAPFRESVVIDGSTTDPRSFMRLTVAPGERHHGQPFIGAYIQPSEPGHGIEVKTPFTHLEWIQVARWAVNAQELDSYDGIRVLADEVVIDYAFIHDDGAQAENPDSIGINAEAASIHLTVRHSIVHNVSRAGIFIMEKPDVVLDVVNCTVHRCAFNDNVTNGYGCVGSRSADDAVVNVVNTIAADAPFAFNHSDPFEVTATWGDVKNNISSDQTAPGPGSQLDVPTSELFVSAASGDLHILAGSPAVEAGVAMDDVPALDIDEEVRPAASWDIGADER